MNRLKENMIMRATYALLILIGMLPFIVLAMALFVIGVLLDGVTGIGHHVFLIASGISLGASAAHQWHTR